MRQLRTLFTLQTKLNQCPSTAVTQVPTGTHRYTQLHPGTHKYTQVHPGRYTVNHARLGTPPPFASGIKNSLRYACAKSKALHKTWLFPLQQTSSGCCLAERLSRATLLRCTHSVFISGNLGFRVWTLRRCPSLSLGYL